MKNTIENLKNKVNAIKEAREANDSGFSLLELVVAVGILLVLTIGGLIAYSGITDNARNAAVQSAASEIYTAATAKEAAGETQTGAEDAAQEWINSSKDDKFQVFVNEETNAVRVVSKAGGNSATAPSNGQATVEVEKTTTP